MTDTAYAARYPGKPGYGAACLNDEFHRETTKFVAKCIRNGATVELVSIEAARAGLLEYVNARKTEKPHD